MWPWTSEKTEQSEERGAGLLYDYWWQIRLTTDGVTTSIFNSYLAFLHHLKDPEISQKTGMPFVVPHATPSEQADIRLALRCPYYRYLHVLYLICAFDELAALVEKNGDIFLAAEMRQARDEATQLRDAFVSSGQMTEQQFAGITRLVEEEVGRDQYGWPQKDLPLERPVTKQWSKEAIANLPPDDVLLVQTADPHKVCSTVFHGQNKQVIRHDIDFNQLVIQIYRLRRELERGTPLAHLQQHLGWFHSHIFRHLPNTNGTIFYVGLGVFAHLPISLMTTQPTVCLKVRPQFSAPIIPRSFRGTALWSTRAPTPLVHTERECQSLPGFTAKPATRDHLLVALFHEEPVHLAVHAVASSYSNVEAKLVLMDGEVSIEDLTQKRLATLLVFLAACETSVHGVVVRGSKSLAEALLNAGVGAVVATKWRIPDDQAVVIAEAFWGWIRAGLDPIQALHEARRELNSPHAHAFELHF